MREFFRKVELLQWDDHRYYHQCRINQTLHLISAISFLVAYVLLFIEPAMAGIVSWLVGMVTRQSWHIFFEPRGHDRIHDVSYEYKESIKVGYNMRRKAILISVWLALPTLLYLSPSLLGLIQPASGFPGYLHDVGLLWLSLGIGGVILRTLHLFVLRGPVLGLAWACKILLDPFHNVSIYWQSPLALLRGERYDHMDSQHLAQSDSVPKAAE
jgi:hypothetical protein